MMQGQWDGAPIYAVAPAGDRVLFVGRSAGIQNTQPATTHLLCVDGKTGKPIWKSDKGALANWSFLGRPLVHGDHFYAVAHPSDTQEFNLLTIGLSNGELLSKLPIGTPALGTNMRGMQVAPIPEILEHEGAVYILTNNGGLIATDPVARQVLWAFTYETHIEQQQTFWYNQQVKVPPLALGAMLIDNGTLFIKEYKGEQIYALDLAGPRLDWKRPIDNTVTLAAADGHDLYVVGTEADCIDRDSRDMQWSAKLSTDTSYMQPIISGGNIFVFGERGIQQVRAGDGAAAPIFRGFDRDSAGGCLWQTRDKLVTVSNLAVTAYPVGQGSKP
jgi:outer membrane protein assembly factor BamB